MSSPGHSPRGAGLTALGTCGGFPEPGRSCSGFLLEIEGFSVLLDAGYGTVARLLELRPTAQVDAIVITHEHPDHCLDLQVLARMLVHGPHAGGPVPLFCPPGVLDRLAGIEPDLDLRAVFSHSSLPGTYDLGPLRLTSMLLPHFVDNAGVRIEGAGLTVAYTGDTAPVAALADLGRDADLFIVEATGRPGETARPERNLMTATEAGHWAREAGARRLLLTHFWPGTDRERAVADARAQFAGEVLAADEGLSLRL